MLLDPFYRQCEQRSAPLYKYGVTRRSGVHLLNNVLNPKTLLLVEHDSIVTVAPLADSGERERP